MPQPSIDRLREAIRNLHGCDSTWLLSVPMTVTEAWRGESAWDGVVEVFELIDHSTANLCYAWAHAVDDDSNRWRFVAVLHEGLLDSPQAAVEAAIAQEHRGTLVAAPLIEPVPSVDEEPAGPQPAELT